MVRYEILWGVAGIMRGARVDEIEIRRFCGDLVLEECFDESRQAFLWRVRMFTYTSTIMSIMETYCP